jgi:glutathione S-transferase
MYTLYWSHGAASLAVHFCLEESGARYETKLVDMAQNAHRSAEYLKINPSGKIPTLMVDGNFAMTESAAICMLIADRHPEAKLAPAANDMKRGHYYMWLTYLTNTLQPAMLRYYYPDRITTAIAETRGIEDKAREEIAAIWNLIDTHLKAYGPYLLGDQFSAADAFCYMLSTWQRCCPDAYGRFPSLKRLADRVSARPAIGRILQVNRAV